MQVKDYIPKFLLDIEELRTIYNVQQIEIDKLNADAKDLLNQFFVASATWGLSRWEEFVGFNTDTGKSIEERRARILAKLRGQGTTTVQMLTNVCKAYVEDVSIVEHPSKYFFDINLNSNKGFPNALEDLYESVDEIKPAHLATHFSLTSILI